VFQTLLLGLPFNILALRNYARYSGCIFTPVTTVPLLCVQLLGLVINHVRVSQRFTWTEFQTLKELSC